MTKTIKLAMAACLAMGSVGLAQDNTARDRLPDTTTPPNQGSAPADRASGRDPSGRNNAAAESGARDRLPDSNTAGMTGATGAAAAEDQAMQQQLAAIAKQPETAGDKLFILDAAMGNQWEIAFSRIVAERATNNEVKAAAQHIIDDHTAAQGRLQQVAQKNNVALPTSLPPMKQQKLQVFRAMSVDDLEKCFVVDTRAAHAKDISSYADHAKTVKNADLKAYVTETLPKLRQHAQHIETAGAAKGLQSDMAGSGQPRQGGQMPTGRTE